MARARTTTHFLPKFENAAESKRLTGGAAAGATSLMCVSKKHSGSLVMAPPFYAKNSTGKRAARNGRGRPDPTESSRAGNAFSRLAALLLRDHFRAVWDEDDNATACCGCADAAFANATVGATALAAATIAAFDGVGLPSSGPRAFEDGDAAPTAAAFEDGDAALAAWWADAAREGLSYSFECVAPRVLGDHGATPPGAYVVLTAIARDGEFLSPARVLTLATKWRLPLVEALFVPWSGAAAVEDELRAARWTMANADADALFAKAGGVVQRFLKHEDVQGPVLFRGADMSLMNRGAAAGSTWIFRGDGSAATPRPRRGYSVKADRDDAAAATWIFRGDGSAATPRPRR